MLKQILQTAIDKVFLEMKGIEDYYIFWNKENGKLTLRSVVTAVKTTTISEVSISGIDLPDSNFVIRDPKRLLNLFDIAENEVEVTIDNKKYGEKLIIKDDSFESQFTLCDVATVRNKPAVIDEPISYDFTMHFDKTFIEKFLKAKGANNETQVVSVEVSNRKARFELGDIDSYSNKIKFFVEDEGMFDMKKCYFSSDAIKEILKLNKKLSGRIDVHEETLMKISFQEVVGNNTLDISYFTIALDQL